MKREHLYIVENINWYSQCQKHYESFLKKKKKKELLYDLVIPLLGIYPLKKKETLDFSGGAVDKNLPTNAEDMAGDLV